MSQLQEVKRRQRISEEDAHLREAACSVGCFVFVLVASILATTLSRDPFDRFDFSKLLMIPGVFPAIAFGTLLQTSMLARVVEGERVHSNVTFYFAVFAWAGFWLLVVPVLLINVL